MNVVRKREAAQSALKVSAHDRSSHERHTHPVLGLCCIVALATLPLRSSPITASDGVATSNGASAPPTRAYGVHTTYGPPGGPANYYPQIKESLGVQLVRVHASWARVESTPGVRDWGALNAHVNEARNQGIDLLFIIGGSPGWANGDASNEWTVPTGEPAFGAWVQQYRLFVRALVTEFRGRVRSWELWNEPNLTQFWAPAPNADDYITWSTAIHDEIRTLDPTANVAFGSLVIPDVPLSPGQIAGRDMLQRLYDRGVVPEIVSVHPYSFGNEGPDVYAPGDMRNTFRDTQTIREVMLANEPPGVKSRVWITEFGWQTGSTHGSPPISMTEALRADYLERSIEIIEFEQPFIDTVIWFWDWDRPSQPAFNGFGLLTGPAAVPVRTSASEVFQETARRTPLLIEGFESASAIQDNWAVWTNNPVGLPGSANLLQHGLQSEQPKPRGGLQRALRLRSRQMAGTPYPGLYCRSAPVSVREGQEYVLSLFSRCSGATDVAILPAGSSGQSVGYFEWALPVGSAAWSQAEHAFVAPTGAETVQIRFRVRASAAVAELDLIKLSRTRD